MQAGRSGNVLYSGDGSFGVHVRIKVDAAVRELAELSLLLELSGLRGVLYASRKSAHSPYHSSIALVMGWSRSSVRLRAHARDAAGSGGRARARAAERTYSESAMVAVSWVVEGFAVR